MTLVLAEKDAATILSEVLARYRTATGESLAPADPRRLLLQTIVLELAQQRALIDFAGKQSLVGYVSATWIDALAELWGETRVAAGPSQCTLRFTFPVAGVHTVPAGTRATDGNYLWAVDEATTSAPLATYVDAVASCTTNGSASNDVAIGQIDTLVDPIAGCSGVANTTETISGRDLETTEEFRARLLTVPERFTTCGPRRAYEALAREASSDVDDAVALGPDDAAEMAGTAPAPGEVHVYVMEVGESTPSGGLLTAVKDALSAEEVRPLTDLVEVMAPELVDYDIGYTWYISRSRSESAVEITEAVEAAHDAYVAWQRHIGRDINPSELIGRLMAAGARRVEVTSPAYAKLLRDQCADLIYDTPVYGGLEDD